MAVLKLILSVYGIVFLAELPDKTALAALVLATRHKPLPVFLGAAAALTIQSVVAIAAGQLFSLLPHRLVHIVSGGVFLVSAIAMWLRKNDDDDESLTAHSVDFWRAAWAVFVVIFIAEWGDLTQIATAALAARYAAPVAVFVGATAALWSVTGIAIFVGNRAGKLINPEITKRAAAALFGVVGLALIAGVL